MKNFVGKKYTLIAVLTVFISISLFADSKYTVQKGDTLYSISKKYQITVAELRTANNLSEADIIKSGQTLVIPSPDISTAASLAGEKKSSSSGSSAKTETYVVQKGDTLYGIARKNGMSVSELMNINNFDSSTVLKAGQKIKLTKSQAAPEKTTSTVTKAKEPEVKIETQEIKATDTRSYGITIQSDSTTVWPVKNPKVTQVKGKVSGVQLSAQSNETVNCIKEGTVMYVGVYRGFGQVLFVQSQTGMIYAYTGLGSVSVKKGDYVVSGTDLGTAGVDSITGKPGITFMVFQNGQPIDPSTAPRN